MTSLPFPAPPTAGVVVADTSLIAGETSLVTFTFSAAVSGFDNTDITVQNGTLSTVSTGDGGITWTATLTPTAGVTDANNVVTVALTGVTETIGSLPGVGTATSNNYAIDTARPTATIVVADTSLIAGETSLVTITFSEAVTGFTNSDLTIANGTLSAVSSGDGNVTWTATFTPTANMTDSTNVITLANTGVSDGAGNTGTGTTNSNNYAIDTLRPTATIVVADTLLIAGETSLVTITFSEAVTGFTNSDLTVASGTLSAVSSGDGNVTWTATFTPTANLTDSTNVITLANTGVSDGAGNTGSGTTNSNNYAIDTLRPTATIVVADSALTVGETSLVTITFSEAVAGFTNTDLTVPNGTLSPVSTADSGITWTATFTPNTNVNSAVNVIALNNTGVSDAAGNSGSGTTNSNNFTIDTVVGPEVSLQLTGSTLAENGGSVTVQATLSTSSIQNVTINLGFSGIATNNTDYSASANTITILAGQTSGSITLTGLDDITFEGNESIIVDVTSVTNGTENGTQSVTASITDDEIQPSVSLALAGSSIAENGGVATVQATLSNPSAQNVVVTLGFTGTATNNTDYAASSNTITILAGQTSGSITLTSIDDATFEGNESIIVDVTGVTNGTENGSQSVSATITDDDSQPSVTLAVAGSSLAENGGLATVRATLSNPSTQDVTVTLGIAGTGTNNTDYSASSNTITILAGQTSGSITLTGIDDATFEGNESIIVDVTGVTNGNEAGTQSITATITDDETQPSVSLVLADSPLAENGGVATVRATLSNPSTQDVTVTLGFSGSATNNTDYSASSNTIVILAGQTSGSITLTGIDDLTFEGNESIIVDVTSVTNGTENGTQSITASITDSLSPNLGPINTVPGGQTVNEDTPLVITGISISDADAGTANVSVTLSVVSGTLNVSTNAVNGVTSGAISGNGGASVTIIGSLAAINATLASVSGVTYQGTLNFNGSDDLTVTTNDLGNTGVGGALTDTDTIAINLVSVNDAPVNTIPGGQGITTDVLTAITGISFSDVDAAGANVSLTLGVAHGTVTVLNNVGGGLTTGNIANNGTATVTITAPLSLINTTLANATGLRYLSSLGYEGTDGLTVTTSDLGNTGGGGVKIDVDTIALSLSTTNDPPVNTVPGAKTVNEDTLLAVTGISITDPDAGTANVSVTFSVAHGTVNVLGSVASGVTSGAISGNGSSSVTITAPLAAINTTLANATGLRYQGVLNYNGTDALTVSTNDLGNTGSGGALVDTDTIGITVNPVNDNPINTLPTINTNEDTPVAVTGFSISDVDSTGPFSVNVRFNNTGAGTLMLRTDVPSGLTSGNILNNGTPNLTILGASLAAINTTLGNASGLIYTPTANFNGFALFAVDTNSDGNGGSDVGDTAIWSVTAVNDAPVNTIPSSLSTNEDSAVAITGIAISDIEAGSNTVRVTLTAANGVLNLSSTVVSGVTAGQITGSGTGTVTLNASIAAINTTLANASGLSFSPTANFNGSTTVTVVTNDLANTGLGGALTDTDTINITVSAVNDGPINSVPASATVAANVAMAITGLSISDIDSGTANISVTLSAASGTLNVLTNVGGGVTGGQITNNGTGTVTITAPIANINATLASATGVTYQGSLNFTGTVNLTVTTNDLGNTGSGSALTDTDTIAITVTEVNASLAILGSPFAENGGTATVRATLSNPLPQNVTVNLGFSGAATNNTDYSASANAITILAGQTSGSITLTGIDDALSEAAESIVVDITGVTNGSENGVQQVTAQIGNSLTAVVAANTPGSVVDLDRYVVSGSTLTINGTPGDDTIGFVRIDATSFYTYFGNELVVFSTASINQVIVVGGAGTDSFSPAGASTVVETVTLGYKSLGLTSTGLSLQSDTEVNIPNGQLADSVTLNDSTGNDLLYLLPSYAFMWNPLVGDYISWPVGFGTVTAGASTGTDTLLFYGEAGPQTFSMSATQSSLTSGGRTLTANNFEQQFAYGSTGDIANLTGTSGNDIFYRLDPYMILVTGSSLQEPIGFPEVNVASGGGVDTAVFYDSAGDDTFTGSPTQSSFQTTTDLARVNNFRNVYAIATAGNDTANLEGSSGNDVFYGGRTASTLLSSSPGYILQVLAFDVVHANLALGSAGNDQAFLDDGPALTRSRRRTASPSSSILPAIGFALRPLTKSTPAVPAAA